MGEPPTAPGQRGAATTERCREDGRQGIWAFSGRLPRGALTRDPHWLDAPGVVPRPHLTLRPEPEGDTPGSWEESVPGVLGALRSTRKGGGDPSPDSPLVPAASVLGPRSSWPSGQAAPAFHKPLPGPEGWRCPGSQHRQTMDRPQLRQGHRPEALGPERGHGPPPTGDPDMPTMVHPGGLEPQAATACLELAEEGASPRAG